MDNPYEPPALSALDLGDCELSGVPFARASYVIDEDYARVVARQIHRVRHDHRLLVWLRIGGIILFLVWTWQLVTRGHWLGAVVSFVIALWLVFLRQLATRQLIQQFRQARTLGTAAGVEFFEEAMRVRGVYSVQVIPWPNVGQAAFFPEGLMLTLATSGHIWIPLAAIEGKRPLADFVTTHVRVDRRYRSDWN